MGDFIEPDTMEGWKKAYRDLLASNDKSVLIYNTTIEKYHHETHPSGKGGPCVLCRMIKDIGQQLRKVT